jgi:Ca-activated chloride channel family protein
MFGAMLMLQPWVGLVSAASAIAVAAGVVLVSRRRHGGLPDGDDAAIANVHHAEASALFRRLRRRYHLLLGGELAALSIVGLAAVGLTMRPATDREVERDVRNRDVMLCLDVSASMNELDAIVLRQFAELAAGLEGERIGLTIFNGSAITAFPLTDDAEFIGQTLDEAATALAQRKRSFVEGTEEGSGTSLVGDGLASCAMRFDEGERGRSRSIVFATDNALAGEPFLQLTEAADLVRQRGIRIYALAAADRITDSDAVALRLAAESTGGAYFETGASAPTAAVVAEIGRLDASRLDVPPEVIADDRPTAWIIACVAGLGALLAVGWSLRR